MNTRSCVTVTWREGTHLFLAIPAARGPQVSLIRRKQAASARVLQRQQQQARRLSRAQVRGFSLVNRRYFTAGNTGMYMISLKNNNTSFNSSLVACFYYVCINFTNRRLKNCVRLARHANQTRSEGRLAHVSRRLVTGAGRAKTGKGGKGGISLN